MFEDREEAIYTIVGIAFVIVCSVALYCLFKALINAMKVV